MTVEAAATPSSNRRLSPAALAGAQSRSGNRMERRRATSKRKTPLPDALSYTVNDACEITGIGRTKLYELIRDGKLKVSYELGRTLIVGDSLRALINAA